jgi:hypothetical protein
MLAAGCVLCGSKLAMAGFFDDACLAPGTQTIQDEGYLYIRERRWLAFDDLTNLSET